MAKVIVYTRFSPRPNAADCDSCEKQLRRCVSYVNNRIDWPSVQGEFHERATSGDSLESRPELQKAVDILEQGDILLVASNDRLARDSLAYLMIQKAVQDKGATIEFADGSPPATTPEGTLFQSILAAFATYQRSVTKQRTSVGVKKALKKRMEDGKHQGKAPFGWKFVGGDLHRNEREQSILLDIENMISGNRNATGNIGFRVFSNEEIARKINKEWGYLRKKPATAAAIRRLIRKHGF